MRQLLQKATIAIILTFCATVIVADEADADESTPSTFGKQIADVSLQDFRGKHVSFADFKESKLIVVAFLGTECPLAKLYGPRLEALHQQYIDADVTVIGINSNLQDSITELAAYARIHKLTFPLLKDPGNRIADQFAAVRTPEVFVLDQSRTVRYWGRIDDQYGIGYVRDEPRRHDLKLAIEALLAGEPVATPVAPSVGCYIGRVSEPDANSPVTYSNQISRILQKRCVECHRQGEIAPFALTDYDEVAGWAETIAEVVEEERMPPWHASPKHGKFLNDRRLTDKEKETIRQWVDAGAPQGDPQQLPPSQSYTTGWQLDQEPDLIVEMRRTPFTVAAEGVLQYQYFTSDYEFTEDKWIKAAEVMPGNRAVVHHILVFVKTKTSRFNEGEGFLAAYVPGLRAAPFPQGMAKRIPGAKLYFQLHYTPIGSEQTDMSKIGLVFTDQERVTHEVRTAAASTKRLFIPPHDDDFEAQARSGSVGYDVQLLSMMPHMHLRGKSFTYEANFADGSKTMLLDVPRYDFNWQTSYRLTEPLLLPAGSTLHCVAHYDNSENNLNNPDPSATVRWGPQTWHEMLFGYFDYAVAIEHTEHGDNTNPRPAREAFAKGVLKQLDRNQDGKISRPETPARYVQQFNQLDANRDGELTLDELLREPGSP